MEIDCTRQPDHHSPAMCSSYGLIPEQLKNQASVVHRDQWCLIGRPDPTGPHQGGLFFHVQTAATEELQHCAASPVPDAQRLYLGILPRRTTDQRSCNMPIERLRLCFITPHETASVSTYQSGREVT